MTTTHSAALPPVDDDAGAVAARCFQLAGEMKAGPVRDALLAMGRDYTLRARAIAQTAAFRFELARSPRATPLTRLFDFLADLTAPLPRTQTRRAATAVMPAPQRVQRTQPTPVVTRAAPRRGSRLFRMHALTRPGA